MFPPGGMTCPTQSLAISKKRLKTDTYIPSLFDPLTLALSILILFTKNNISNILYSICFIFIFIQLTKVKRPLTLACSSVFLFYPFYLYLLYN